MEGWTHWLFDHYTGEGKGRNGSHLLEGIWNVALYMPGWSSTASMLTAACAAPAAPWPVGLRATLRGPPRDGPVSTGAAPPPTTKPWM